MENNGLSDEMINSIVGNQSYGFYLYCKMADAFMPFKGVEYNNVVFPYLNEFEVRKQEFELFLGSKYNDDDKPICECINAYLYLKE